LPESEFFNSIGLDRTLTSVRQMTAPGRLGEVGNVRFGGVSSKKPGLAERLLSGNRYFRFGHAPVMSMFEKLP
jgi:hypothetical protein